MPTYVYKFVDTGETIEVQQGFHDDNLTEIAHPGTGEVLPVKKVFTPVGVTFKGSGFFKTDNRGKKSSTSTASSSDSSSSGSESKGSKGSDSKGADSGGSSSSGSESKSTESSAKSDTSKPTAASSSSD